MPRKKTIHTSQYPYHIVSRSNHKDWFKIPLSEVWKISIKCFQIALEKHPVKIHSFVLMQNHYHLVVETPESNISSFMYEFNKNFSLKLRMASGKINRMFGGRYRWSLIKNESHYYHVIKYVFLNPVKAGVVEDCILYPYSTLNCSLNKKYFPCDVEPYADFTKELFLNWLNQKHSVEQQECISRGLKWSEFRFSGTNENRKVPVFESEMKFA